MNPCTVCGSPMNSQYDWRRATPEQRAIWKDFGLRAHAAAGKCHNCYQAERKAAKAVTPTPTHPCWRCGIQTHAETCRDCVDVLELLEAS